MPALRDGGEAEPKSSSVPKDEDHGCLTGGMRASARLLIRHGKFTENWSRIGMA
jgi:hypothetical protein